jgi:hypothetical protein
MELSLIYPTEIAAIRQSANIANMPEVSQESLARQYSFNCSWWHSKTGTILVYTHDGGNNKIGLEDPALNNAIHLSLAFTKPEVTLQAQWLYNKPAATAMQKTPRVAFDWDLAGKWLTALFGDIPETNDNAFMAGPMWQLWREGNGVAQESVHFYLFVDNNWQPIKLPQTASDELLQTHLMRPVLISAHTVSFR